MTDFPPPSAARTATSRRCDVPRASMRLATLAQAMISTSATAPNITASVNHSRALACSFSD